LALSPSGSRALLALTFGYGLYYLVVFLHLNTLSITHTIVIPL
jgi:hypothetical protein